MAKTRLVAVWVILAVLAGACGSTQPTLVSGDSTGDATTLADETDDASDTISVAADSAPVEFEQSASERKKAEHLFGYIWSFTNIDNPDDWGVFTFYGSRPNPRMQIELPCGLARYELVEGRDMNQFHIVSDTTEGCENGSLLRVFADAESFTAAISLRDPDELVLKAANTSIRLNLVEALPSYSFEDNWPTWDLDDAEEEPPSQGDEDGNGIPDDWLPVPELSPQVLADEVLLQDMTFFSEVAAYDEDFWDYMALIGASQYTLVDVAGVPIDSGDEQFNQYLLTITAYHGKSEPVVYSASMQRWFLHPEWGVQTTCDGGFRLSVLQERTNEWFELHFDRALDVFEDRIFYGDSDCERQDGFIPEVFEGRFAIDNSEGKNLRITNEDGTVAHFEWVAIDTDVG